MSEPGNNEGLPINPKGNGEGQQSQGGESVPRGDQPQQPENTEQKRSAEEIAAEQARTAGEGDLAGAVQKGEIPEDMDPEAFTQAAEKMGEIEEGKELASSEQVTNLIEAYKRAGLTRETVAPLLDALQNISPEEKERVLKSVAAKFEDTPQAKQKEDLSEEELASQKNIEQGEVQQLIDQAQSLAQLAEDNPHWNKIEDPTIKQQMRGRLDAAKHYFAHKKGEIAEYFKAPPKEWFKRGVKYTSVGLVAFFLLIIWQMQLINKVNKKK